MLDQHSEADLKAYIARWNTAGPRLAEIALTELRHLSLASRQQQIENLLDLGYQFRRPRIDQGLVRFQAVLQRLHAARGQQK